MTRSRRRWPTLLGLVLACAAATAAAQALISVSLFTEYEDVLARPQVQRRCSLNSQEQQVLFDAFLACTELVSLEAPQDRQPAADTPP